MSRKQLKIVWSSSSELQAGEAARELGKDQTPYQPPSTSSSPVTFPKHTSGRRISSCVYLNCMYKYLIRERNGLFHHKLPLLYAQAHGTDTRRRGGCRHGCEHSYSTGSKPGRCTAKLKAEMQMGKVPFLPLAKQPPGTGGVRLIQQCERKKPI